MASNGGTLCRNALWGRGRERAGRRRNPGVPVTRCAAATGTERRQKMGRYMLLWLLGVPIPILLLIWAFGGLN
jgi:hypothetical protein